MFSTRELRFLNLLFLLLVLIIPIKSYAAARPVNVIDPAIIKALYNPENNVIQGNPKGDVTVVDFFDYNCPYCRKIRPLLDKIVQEDPNVRIVYKEYLVFGEISELPSYAALAANRQGKYLAMHTAMLTDKNPLNRNEILRLAKSLRLNMSQFNADLNDPALKAQIVRNGELAQEIGLQGAPTLVVANTRILDETNKAGTVKQFQLFTPINQDTVTFLIQQARKESKPENNS